MYWQYYAWNSSNPHPASGSYAFSQNVYEYTTPVGATGPTYTAMTAANGATFGATKWVVVSATNSTIESGTLTCGGAKGACTASIPVGPLPANAPAHVIFVVHYTYLGLAREWRQDYSFYKS